jgi:integrase
MTDATPSRRKRTSQFGSARMRGRDRNGQERWQARYVDKAGVRHSGPHMFVSKTEALKWLASVQTDMERGDRTDPRRGRQTFAEWAAEWQEATVDLRPKTLEGYDAILRNHVLPHFGTYRVADIEQATIQRFVARRYREGAEDGTVRNCFRVISAVLSHAVQNKALNANPAVGVRLRAVEEAPPEEQVILTEAEVERLCDAITNPVRQRGQGGHYPEHGLRVRWAAYTGMRSGEIAALRVGNVDFLRRTVRITETVVVAGGEVLDHQPTKNRRKRTIKIPRFLTDQLAEHLGARASDPRALVFPGADGDVSRHNTWYRVHFVPAVRQADLDPRLRFHDLRHTCASMLAAQGHPMIAVSRHLGHSSIQVTDRVYAHLFPATVDDMADTLDAAFERATAAPVQAAEVRQIGDFRAG